MKNRTTILGFFFILTFALGRQKNQKVIVLRLL